MINGIHFGRARAASPIPLGCNSDITIRGCARLPLGKWNKNLAKKNKQTNEWHAISAAAVLSSTELMHTNTTAKNRHCTVLLHGTILTLIRAYAHSHIRWCHPQFARCALLHPKNVRCPCPCMCTQRAQRRARCECLFTSNPYFNCLCRTPF